MIRLASPSLDEADLAAVKAVLRSGFLVQGDQVAVFEAAVAARVGAAHAVAVSSGTAALHISLLALGVGGGDEVAVPCYSWPATANVVVRVGADPVFVDIDPLTMNVDVRALERTVSEHPRIKAVMPVHAFGAMADMTPIVALAKERGIEVVEDAACALGAVQCGRNAGTWGRVGCFSFHPRKVVTTGEGGAITTNDPEVAASLRELRNHGQGSGTAAGEFRAAGLNYRMTEFQAALGASQLTRLDEFLQRRRRLAQRYATLLDGLDLQLPRPATPEVSAFQSYVVLLSRKLAPARAAIMARLRTAGVEVAIGTHHIPLTTYFNRRSGYKPGDFPVTDDVAARAMSLPMHHGLDEESQEFVASAFRQAMQEVGTS